MSQVVSLYVRMSWLLLTLTSNQYNKPMQEGQFGHGVQQPGPTEAVSAHPNGRPSLNAQASPTYSVLSTKTEHNCSSQNKEASLTRRRWNGDRQRFKYNNKNAHSPSQTELPRSSEKLTLKNDEPMLGTGNVQVDPWASSHLIMQRSSLLWHEGGNWKKITEANNRASAGTYEKSLVFLEDSSKQTQSFEKWKIKRCVCSAFLV